MNVPLVSIVVPCRNAAQWLPATLASARAQTWPRCEIIVVDDESTDGSAEVARQHGGPNVLLLTQVRSGAAAARQRALEAAHGEYLQYLDADDLLHPEKIARQVMMLTAGRSDHIAAGRWYRFSGEPKVDPLGDGSREPNWHDATPVGYLTETFTSGTMMHPAAWLVPRAVATRAGPWNAQLSLDDDGEYFTRAVLASAAVAFCDTAISYYRSNLTGSLSGRRSHAAWRSAFEVCRLCTEALLQRENSERTRRACALYWLRFAFAAYPEGEALVDDALARAKKIDPLARRPPAGPWFERSTRLLGWKMTRRLQRALRH